MEIIDEFKSKLTTLINTKKSLISDEKNKLIHNSNSEDKKIILELLNNSSNIQLLENNLNIIKKYCSNNDISFYKAYIKQAKTYKGIAYDLFIESNKDNLLLKLQSINDSIIVVDDVQIKNNIQRLELEVSHLVAIEEKIDNNTLSEEDMINIISLSKTLNVNSVKLILELVRNLTKLLYDYDQDIPEEDEVDEIEQNNIELTDEQLIAFFDQYNCNYLALKEPKKNLLRKYGDLDKIKQILDLFDKFNINLGTRFNNKTIFEEVQNVINIFIYAQVNDIKEVLDKVKSYDLLSDNRSITETLKMLEIFIPSKKSYNNIEQEIERLPINSDDEKPNLIKISGRLEHFKRNLDYLYDIYVNIKLQSNPNITSSELKEGFKKQVYYYGATGIDQRHEKVLNYKRICDIYNIDEGNFITTVSSIKFGNYATHLDEYIEMDCYDYISKNLSLLSIGKVFNMIAFAKQKMGLSNDQIFKENNDNSDLTKSTKKLVMRKTKLQNIVKSNNVTLKKPTLYVSNDNKLLFATLNNIVLKEFNSNESDFFSNYSYYKNIVNKKGFEYYDLLKDFVDDDNPLIIRIEGIPISRIKLLRVYSIYNNHSMNDSIDRLLYAITFKSHYTKAQVETIKNKLNELSKGKEKIK